ncbi:MAG TPA: alpha/beta hydrolase, partial [Puia sp.]
KLPESDVNDLGFILSGKNRKKDALEIFKYNLEANPNSSNAFESLAEGYEGAGEKELALKNYKRSVELDPKNNYAVDRIKKLEGEINGR